MEIQIRVTGMTCMHCVSAVTKALQAVPGVEKAEVSLDEGWATVTGDAEPAQLLAAIEAEGYSAHLQ
jgi:copper chaperone CopZ